ncbi:MAG: hypothetical protein U1F66_09335 [bacterium]
MLQCPRSFIQPLRLLLLCLAFLLVLACTGKKDQGQDSFSSPAQSITSTNTNVSKVDSAGDFQNEGGEGDAGKANGDAGGQQDKDKDDGGKPEEDDAFRLIVN